jgi:hypothetical protein
LCLLPLRHDEVAFSLLFALDEAALGRGAWWGSKEDGAI